MLNYEEVSAQRIAELGAEMAELARQRFLQSRGVDLTPKEKQQWSLVRAVRAALSGDWSDAKLEQKASMATYERLEQRPRGMRSFMIPADVLYGTPWSRNARAPYLVGTAAQGGNLVATQLAAGDFIEVLRNASVTAQLGARFLAGLVGNVDIPRQISQTQVFWVGESSAPTESEATFDKVSLRPKTIGALSKMSRLMLLQSSPDIEMIAREDLVATGALGIDLAAISGSGASNQPLGIVNTSGVGAVVGGTNGANVTFDHLIQLYTKPLVSNAPQENLGFAMNGKTKAYLATQKSSTGQYLWMPDGGVSSAAARSVVGYPYAVSNQLRSNLTKGTSSGICSEIVYGNWRELLIGLWGTVEIMVNPYDATGFTTGDVLIRMFQTVDISVRNAASFAVMSDALTPGF